MYSFKVSKGNYLNSCSPQNHHSLCLISRKGNFRPGGSLKCQLLSVALLEDRCVNRCNMARKAPGVLWCQPVLPLNTQQLSERSRGIRVVIYMLKIVTIPSLAPWVWITDSSICFSSKPSLTLDTIALNTLAAGPGFYLESGWRQTDVFLCVWESGIWWLAAVD